MVKRIALLVIRDVKLFFGDIKNISLILLISAVMIPLLNVAETKLSETQQHPSIHLAVASSNSEVTKALSRQKNLVVSLVSGVSRSEVGIKFDAAIIQNHGSSGTVAFSILYDSSSVKSTSAVSSIQAILQSLNNNALIKNGKSAIVSTLDDTNSGGGINSTWSFFACIASFSILTGVSFMAVQVITREREHKTIQLLFMSNLRREEVAVGKLISVTMCGVICLLLALVGQSLTSFYLLKYVHYSGAAFPAMSTGQIASFIGAALMMVLLLSILCSLIALLSNTQAQANATTTFVNISILFSGMVPLFTSQNIVNSKNTWWIPLYDLILIMSSAISSRTSMSYFLSTVAVFVICLCALTLTYIGLFKREKVVE